MAKKTIKLCDGFRVIHEDGVIETDDFRGIFTDIFGWDLENDKEAKAGYEMCIREVYCFGYVDLTKACNGHKLIIEAIPPTEPIVKEVEE